MPRMKPFLPNRFASNKRAKAPLQGAGALDSAEDPPMPRTVYFVSGLVLGGALVWAVGRLNRSSDRSDREWVSDPYYKVTKG